MNQYDAATRGNRVILQWQTLYEQYGDRCYRIESFKPYDLDRDNRNFLRADTGVTFLDRRETLYELADLYYHGMVLMVQASLTIEELEQELPSHHVMDSREKEESSR